MKSLLIIIFTLLMAGSAFSQRELSSGRVNSFKGQSIKAADNNESFNSRFFCFKYAYGLCKGFLNSPGNVEVVDLNQYYSVYGAAIVPGQNYLYAANNESGAPTLEKIDTTTGEKTIIGAIPNPAGTAGIWEVPALAWDKTTNKMYALATPYGTPAYLCTIDLSTGNMTTVAILSSASYSGLAINSAGVMYTYYVAPGSGINLGTLNKTTGAVTNIGPSGLASVYITSLALDPTTDSLYAAVYLNTGTNSRFYKCSSSTGALTLIGDFATSEMYEGLVIPEASSRQLNNFNLQSPQVNTRIVSLPGSQQTITFNWDTAAAGANYKLYFGNPSVSQRRFTLSTTEISITFTLAKLDSLLASVGFTNNGSATDSAIGQWSVTAFKGPGASGPDSMPAMNGPRSITLRRQQAFLTPFVLNSPEDNFSVSVSQTDTSRVNFIWSKSGPGLTYNFLFKTGNSYSDPATFRFSSNSNGYDSILSLRKSFIDSALIRVGVAAGDSLTGYWRVRAYSNVDSINSTVQDRKITFKRRTLTPLSENFTEEDFPPQYWLTEPSPVYFTYWSRSYSGSDPSNGFVKYNFWTAISGRPLEGLITPEFVRTTPGNNYLKFKYSYAYFIESGFLSNDSCIIEYSTNGGSSWIKLIGMGASTVLTSGTNSSPNMSTFASQDPFLPSNESQWAYKMFSIPSGVNRIRFNAKSDHGNNLYIDDISVIHETGVTTQLNLIPEKFELSQNYPNPFNPVTKINFSVPKAGFISIKVYDINGKEIKNLVNEFKSAGNYFVNFDGSSLASGTYFYRIETGEFKEVKKMILIK